MTTEDIIDRLPYELAARLECDPFFVDIPVVVADAGNLNLEMERKQALITKKSGKYGAAVIVLQIVADEDPRYKEVHGPMILRPAFQVVENVELNNRVNGTKKSHRKIARRIVRLVKLFMLDGYCQSMKSGSPAIEPVDLSELGASVKSSQVNFECLERLSEKTEYVDTPRITATGNSPETAAVELSCQTPGAEIWFTLDDSPVYNGGAVVYPASTAQQYTGPIPINATPQILRAAAFVAGQFASGVIRRSVFYST